MGSVQSWSSSTSFLCEFNLTENTTHMGLIVGDWICSVIIKTPMAPGPWTLITYSAWLVLFYPCFLSTDSICFALSADVTAGFSLCLILLWVYLPPNGVSKLTLGSTALEEFVAKKGLKVRASLICKWFLPGTICLSRCSHTQMLK